MVCPACENQLTEVTVDGIKVDVCENGCGGIWFDNFELKKFETSENPAGEKLLHIQRDPVIEIDPTRDRYCPRCGTQKMVKHFHSVKHEVEIDECYACGGVWLDQGELAQIRQQFHSESEKNEMTQNAFIATFGPELEAMKQKSKEDAARASRFSFIFRYLNRKK